MVKKKSKKTNFDEEEEEHEITSPKVSKTDGKWGWFIVFNSFVCNMVVDGMQYTFANFMVPIETTFNKGATAVSLIGSLLSGFYNFAGPLGSALGNKFGLRMVCITGSITSSFGLSISYFAPNVEYLFIFYGVLGGLGFGMIYMASVIITSIYFEKYRALAASVSVCGTGVGTFVFAPLGNYLVHNYGWRWALVVEGALILICILCALSFKPIQIISVIPISEEPSLVSDEMDFYKRGSIYYPPGSQHRKTLPNVAYPTFKEALSQDNDERRQTMARASTYTPMEPRMLPIYSIVPSSEINVKRLDQKSCHYKCRLCCFNFWHCRCHHRDLNLGDRPLYRDDIFYEGKLHDFSNYSSQERLDYHLSVTRIPGPKDIQEHAQQKCCICHQAFIRACVTMMGLHLLKSKIFIFLCISSFFYTMGLYIPYVFIRKLSEQYGISQDVGVWLISTIGIANTTGRLASGILKSFVKVNASIIVLVCLLASGLFSFIFVFPPTVETMFSFSIIFGFFTAPFISLRPVIIVEFLGLEKLTNAFGLVLLSQGVASIIGPPIAGAIEENTKNDIFVFYFAGSLMLLSGIALLISVMLHFKAKEKNEEELKSENDEDESEGEKNKEGEKDFAIIPPNGGWGWVVVLSAFYCNVVMDGIQLTFGIFLKTISEEFHATHSEVAVAGSLMFGVHLLMGPVCSGCSAAFGLRPVTIAGCLICCFGVAISYFATDNYFLYFSYGVIGGMGLGLVYMNTLMVTSLYFTTYMPLAIGIVVCGTGVGTMVFAILGHSLLGWTTWRYSFLLQAALVGSMTFAAATFRPLKPVRVKLSVDPKEASLQTKQSQQNKPPTPKRTSIFLKDFENNSSFPSREDIFREFWSNVLEEKVISEISKKNKSLRCCKCCKKWRICSRKKKDKKVLVLAEVAKDARRISYVSRGKDTVLDDGGSTIPTDRSRSIVGESFKRIYIDEEKSKVKTLTLLKQSLVAMLNYRLLKSGAFTLFTICGAIQISTLIIVYIYEIDRCNALGFSEEMSTYFLITLGGSNTFWRLFFGGLALFPKTNRVLSIIGIIIGGVATICSGFSKSAYYQFGFCFLFGLGMASVAVFRIVLLIELVGWELSANATGINLMCMGICCIIIPPLLGWITETKKNYDIIFCTSGSLLLASGLVQLGVHKIRERELKKNEQEIVAQET